MTQPDRPARDYREMLNEELAVVRVESNQDIQSILEQAWRDAQENPREWTDAECAAMLVWSGLGFLAFGRLEHLEATLSTIRRNPEVVRDRRCRYYASALKRLVPWPDTFSPVAEPQRAIDWLHDNEAQLEWDEDLGRFVDELKCYEATLRDLEGEYGYALAG